MHIIDSSVILAFIRGEPGGRRLIEFQDDAAFSAVNLAEMVSKCIEFRLDPEPPIAFVKESGIDVMPFTAEQAVLAGRLRNIAPKGVLSLGDRACIAAAILSGRTAITADRAWLDFDLGCKIELIR